jgi:hypothetical protein
LKQVNFVPNSRAMAEFAPEPEMGGGK